MLFTGCDDGNNISGDGCSESCITEPNFMCEGGDYLNPSICKAVL